MSFLVFVFMFIGLFVIVSIISWVCLMPPQSAPLSYDTAVKMTANAANAANVDNTADNTVDNSDNADAFPVIVAVDNGAGDGGADDGGTGDGGTDDDEVVPYSHHMLSAGAICDTGGTNVANNVTVLNTRVERGRMEEKAEALTDRLVQSWTNAIDIEYNSPNCVTKSPIDAWGDIYGLKTRNPPPRQPSEKGLENAHIYTLLDELLVDNITKNKYQKGLRYDNLKSTSAETVDNYDPT